MGAGRSLRLDGSWEREIDLLCATRCLIRLDAKGRVLIESTDGEETWTTVGSSSDIIEASWLALADSLEYWLWRRQPAAR